MVIERERTRCSFLQPHTHTYTQIYTETSSSRHTQKPGKTHRNTQKTHRHLTANMITVVLPAARTLYSLTMTSLSMCTPLNTHTHIIRVVGQKFSVFKLVCAYLGGRGIVCKLISLKKREGGL